MTMIPPSVFISGAGLGVCLPSDELREDGRLWRDVVLMEQRWPDLWMACWETDPRAL